MGTGYLLFLKTCSGFPGLSYVQNRENTVLKLVRPYKHRLMYFYLLLVLSCLIMGIEHTGLSRV